jgi:hypothetical protein
MPRLKRRSKSRLAGFTRWHRYELETGIGWPFLPQDQCFHGDREAIEAAWNELRVPFMRQWIAEHPGSRPWAWWEFDAPERRQCVNDVHPFDRPDRWRETDRLCCAEIQRRTYSLWYGCPALLGPGDFDCRFESQPDYLDRLGLLTAQERAAIEARASKQWGQR